MRIINEDKLDLDDVLLVPQRNTLESRSQVELEREFKFYHSPRTWKGIPFFAANLACLSSFELADALRKHKLCTALHKFHSVQSLSEYFKSYQQELLSKQNYVWVSIGMSDEDILKIKEVSRNTGWNPNLIIDVPNGHLESFVHFCAKVRNEFYNSIIMAGNCVTPEMSQEIILHGGVDIVKIQIGPGKLCTTRLMTGVGYPSLSATIECSAVHGLKSGEKRLGLICSDGGLNTVGDCAKMYAGGADFLMSGSLFYGVDESCGEWEYDTKLVRQVRRCTLDEYRDWRRGLALHDCHVLYYADITSGIYADLDADWSNNDKKKRLKIYGMSSKESQEKHYGEYKKYRASEGRSQYADYKGPVDGVVQELLGGLRSTATYIGANSLKDFNKCAVFCKVNKIHNNMTI